MCIRDRLKDIFMQSIVTKLCYLGVKGGLRNLKHMMDSEEIGEMCIRDSL